MVAMRILTWLAICTGIPILLRINGLSHTHSRWIRFALYEPLRSLVRHQKSLPKSSPDSWNYELNLDQWATYVEPLTSSLDLSISITHKEINLRSFFLSSDDSKSRLSWMASTGAMNIKPF